MELKTILAVIAVVLGFIGYVPYIKDTLTGKTKPHAFSWLVWTVLTAIAFFAQLAKGGEAGAWATGMSALLCLVITALAFKQGEKDIKPIDWLSLVAAGIGLVLWKISNDPLMTVILITLVDVAGYLPTFRKAFHKPHEETVSQYILAALKWIISFAALSSINLTTVLFPAAVALLNTIFSIMVLVRRKTLARN